MEQECLFGVDGVLGHDQSPKKGDLEHRVKYELLNQQRIQQRDASYFECQTVVEPYPGNKKSNFVIQRSIAHAEVAGNGQWVAHEECYCCQRWRYTLLFLEKANI